MPAVSGDVFSNAFPPRKRPLHRLLDAKKIDYPPAVRRLDWHFPTRPSQAFSEAGSPRTMTLTMVLLRPVRPTFTINDLATRGRPRLWSQPMRQFHVSLEPLPRLVGDRPAATH